MPSDAILDRLRKLHPSLIDLSLGRVERLLAALGDPHRQLPPVIHVAGTNGKGSTIAFMRAMAEAAGLSVHAFTSPHLIRFHERIVIGGEPIGEDLLADVLEECEAANRNEPITFFEITTVAALLAFSRAPADLLLLEVGLGGRLDATNVIDQPAVSVITPVGLDHQHFLGETLEEIAFEKAGIIKPRRPAVVGVQEDAAHAVIARRAEELNAPVFAANRDWQAYEQHGRLVWQSENELLDLPLPALAGRFQIDNAGTAIAALRQFGDRRIDEAAIANGLRRARWPGRLQRITRGRLRDLLKEEDELWIDGGHNAHGARALAAALADMEGDSARPLVMICGMMRRKAAAKWLAAFAGLAAVAVCVPIPGHDNAWRPDELADMARQAGLPARPADNLEDALRGAHQGRAEPLRVVIAGSLYLAGHALALNDAGLAEI